MYGSGPTAVVALDGVSVSFPAGEYTAIMGPSGSGKSTLMHCLAGLDTATSGEVYVGGDRLSGMSDKKLTELRRDKVGFVFQQFNLLPTLTAEENITLPLAIAGRKPDPGWFDAVVAAVNLRDRLSHRPTELSGGQQQRVACARALITRPAVVFADEPTGNLDSRSSAEVLGFLRRSVDRARPDRRDGHPRAVRRRVRRPGAVPRRRADRRRAALPDRRLGAGPDEGPGARPRDDVHPGGCVMLRATVKSLLARKLRLLLSAMSIVLGVSFVVGAFVLTDSLGKTFDDLFATVSKNIAVDVRGVEKGEGTANSDGGGSQVRAGRPPWTPSGRSTASPRSSPTSCAPTTTRSPSWARTARR